MEFPLDNLDQYPFPLNSQSLPGQWDSAANLLLGAEQVGLIDQPIRGMGDVPTLGLDAQQSIDPKPALSENNPVRFTVIAENLFLLGYLKTKMKGKDKQVQRSKVFRRAVSNFQIDAELINDEWVGRETWTCLQALVNFESATQLERWLKPDGGVLKAFARAVQLRLSVYGIVEDRPQPDFKSLQQSSLRKFEKILWALGATDSYDIKMPKEEIFEILFDPDQLLGYAANSSGEKNRYSSDRLESEQHKKIEDQLRRFLVNLAKVELWLLGSDIKIDGRDNYPVQGLKVRKVRRGRGHTKRPKPVRSSLVKKYLKEYWTDILQVDDDAGSETDIINPRLFHSLLHPELYTDASGAAFSEEDYSKEILKDFEESADTAERVRNAYTHSKSLGMKLWDGLKRLWRWIKKGIKKIVQFAKNILRAFYRFATKSFTIVKTAFQAFAQSIGQYLNGKLTLNNDDVTVFFSKDFDHTSFIMASANSASIATAARAERRFSSMFSLSCAILGAFIYLLKNAISGLLGWARLLMVLVKSYREIAPLYRQLVNSSLA